MASASFCSCSGRGAVEPACSSHFVSPIVTVGAPASRSTSDRVSSVERRAGHRLVHHSPRRGIGTRDRLAEHQHLPGPDLADPPGQQPRAARVGREAPLAHRAPRGGPTRRRRRSPTPGRGAGRSRPPTPAPGTTTGRLRRDQQLNQPVRLGGQAPLDAADPGPRVAGVSADDVEARAEVLTGPLQEHDTRTDSSGPAADSAAIIACDDGVGEGVALVRAIDLELEHRPDLLDPQPLDRAVGARDLGVAHPPAYLSLIACSASCRFCGATGRVGQSAPDPCSRLGSRMVAWPGVVSSPRWFVAGQLDVDRPGAHPRRGSGSSPTPTATACRPRS